MYQIGVLVLCIAGVRGGWLEEVSSPQGLDLGNGLHLQVIDSGFQNLPPLERYSLRMDYGGVGVSVGKNAKTNDVQVALHVKDKVQGRGKDKKMMEILIPALMGFKATTIGAVAFTAIAALVMKAMGVASIALIVTLCLLVAKLFSAPHVIYPKHVELDAHGSEHHPVFAEFPIHDTGAFMPHAEESSPFYAYSHYSGVPQGHEAVAESQANYAMVESPNGTAAQMSPQQAAIVKRRDQARRTKAPSIVAVKKYTVTSR